MKDKAWGDPTVHPLAAVDDILDEMPEFERELDERANSDPLIAKAARVINALKADGGKMCDDVRRAEDLEHLWQVRLRLVWRVLDPPSQQALMERLSACDVWGEWGKELYDPRRCVHCHREVRRDGDVLIGPTRPRSRYYDGIPDPNADIRPLTADDFVAARRNYLAELEALTPKQRKAIEQLYDGEGDAVELAEVLRPVAHLLPWPADYGPLRPQGVPKGRRH